MSNDLISRKKLLETERLLMTDIVKNNPTARYILEQVLFDIENAPTAYDMDSAVEKFEKMGDIKFSSFSKPLITVEDAIKVVKEGGVK